MNNLHNTLRGVSVNRRMPMMSLIFDNAQRRNKEPKRTAQGGKTDDFDEKTAKKSKVGDAAENGEARGQ